jgi:hypothetical protein
MSLLKANVPAQVTLRVEAQQHSDMFRQDDLLVVLSCQLRDAAAAREAPHILALVHSVAQAAGAGKVTVECLKWGGVG